MLRMWLDVHLLVGGWTSPFEKYYCSQIGRSSPFKKGENKKYLKPPPRLVVLWQHDWILHDGNVNLSSASRGPQEVWPSKPWRWRQGSLYYQPKPCIYIKWEILENYTNHHMCIWFKYCLISWKWVIYVLIQWPLEDGGPGGLPFLFVHRIFEARRWRRVRLKRPPHHEQHHLTMMQ